MMTLVARERDRGRALVHFVSIADGVPVEIKNCETGTLLLAATRMDAKFIDCDFEKYRQKYRHL